MRHEFVKLPLLLGQSTEAVLRSYAFEAPNENNLRWELPERLPAVIVCPGGAYRGGSAKMKEPVALKFLMQGYQAFTLDYGYRDDSDFPLPLLNLARAVHYLKVHADALRLDPNRIAVIGFSAGGHLASLYSSTFNTHTWSSQLDLNPQDLAIQAVIAAYPVLNLSDLILSNTPEDLRNNFGKMFQESTPERDPIEMLQSKTPPHFVFSCLEDKIVRPLATQAFVTRAMELGVPIEYHLFSDGGHGIATADALSMRGQNYPKRTHLWLPLAVHWLNDLFNYHFYEES